MTSLEGPKNFGIKQRKFIWPTRLPLQNQGHHTKLALAHIVNDFIKRKSSSKECSGQLGEEKKPKSNRQLWEERCKAALPRPEENVFMPRPSVSVNARQVTCLPGFQQPDPRGTAQSRVQSMRTGARPLVSQCKQICCLECRRWGRRGSQTGKGC